MKLSKTLRQAIKKRETKRNELVNFYTKTVKDACRGVLSTLLKEDALFIPRSEHMEFEILLLSHPLISNLIESQRKQVESDVLKQICLNVGRFLKTNGLVGVCVSKYDYRDYDGSLFSYSYKSFPKEKNLRVDIDIQKTLEQVSDDEDDESRIVGSSTVTNKCSICRDDFKYPQARTCGHVFCRDCCANSDTCPVCRQESETIPLFFI